jgi:hypothetical protein
MKESETDADVVARQWIAFGPALSARTQWLERTGRLRLNLGFRRPRTALSSALTTARSLSSSLVTSTLWVAWSMRCRKLARALGDQMRLGAGVISTASSAR